MVAINLSATQVKALNEGTISGKEARALLSELKSQLTKTDGSIRRGVFTLKQKADGSATLSTTTTSAITRQSKLDAGSQAISNLFRSAHGVVYERTKEDVESYLTLTHNKFGSKSFVKLEEAFLPADYAVRGEVLKGELGITSIAPTPPRTEGRADVSGLGRIAEKINARSELLKTRATQPPLIVGGDPEGIKTLKRQEVTGKFRRGSVEGSVRSNEFLQVKENQAKLEDLERTPRAGEIYLPKAFSHSPSKGTGKLAQISQKVSETIDGVGAEFQRRKTAEGDQTSAPIRPVISDVGRATFEIGDKPRSEKAGVIVDQLVDLAREHGLTTEEQVYSLGYGLQSDLNAVAPGAFSEAFTGAQSALVGLINKINGESKETRTISPVKDQPGVFEISSTVKEVGKGISIAASGLEQTGFYDAPPGHQFEITHRATIRLAFDLNDASKKPTVEVTEVSSLLEIYQLTLPDETTPAFLEYYPQPKEPPRSSPSQSIQDHLLPLLNESSKEFFKDLLEPPIYKKSPDGVKPTLVLGDADGSAGRILLAGIQAGRIELKPEEYRLLASVLNKESSIKYSGLSEIQSPFGEKGFEHFQSDVETARDLQQIAENATYKSDEEATHKLVFIGDIIHDRFSNNQKALATVIDRLKENKSVFILGNHDDYDTVEHDNTNNDSQFGSKAVIQLTREESEALAQRAFVHSHFDPESGNLFLHNGLTRVKVEDEPPAPSLAQAGSTVTVEAATTENTAAPAIAPGVPAEAPQPTPERAAPPPTTPVGKNSYVTAFGKITADSPQELCSEINKAKPIPRTIHTDDGKRLFEGFSSFRPEDHENDNTTLGNVLQHEGKEVTLIHGHNEDKHGIQNGVINVNARSNGYAVAACVV